MAAIGKGEYREGIDIFLLIVAFVGGVGSALILKIMGFPPYVPALAAGTVIIVYAVATYASSAARLEPEQIGDNCYYLGFCITLASLAYTLYALGSAGDDAAILGDVISGFGVALSSTVVGVMARVVLLQFRVDLAARDKEARSQLNRVMRLFHGEMQASVSSTRETIVQIRQTLEEHTEETIKNNKRMQDSFEKRIDALIEEAVGGVKSAMKEVVESGKDMNKRISASSRANMTTAENAMQASMESVTEELKRATETFEAEMQRANETSVKSLELVVEEVSAAMKRMSEDASNAINNSRDQQNADMSKAVGAVADNVFELATQIGSQKEKISEALDGFTTETRAVREEVGAMVKESAAAREEARKSAQIATVASQKMTWAVEKIEKSRQSVSLVSPVEPSNTDPISAAEATEVQPVTTDVERTVSPGSAQEPIETETAATTSPVTEPAQPASSGPPTSRPNRSSTAKTEPAEPEQRRSRLGSWIGRSK